MLDIYHAAATVTPMRRLALGLGRWLAPGRWLALGLACWLLGCTPQPTAEGASVSFRPCLLKGARHPASCTEVAVPLDHAAPGGPTLKLRVVRIAARGSQPQADPLFLLAGGPGQAASEAFPALLPALHWVLQHRDLVMVDQRGTGASAAMDCDTPSDLTALFRESTLPALAKTCAKKHPHNPRHFSTEQAARDLDAVRRALGYGRINLLGISYGTRLAMAFAAHHPDVTRSLVLDSVAPRELRIPVSFARDAQTSLDHMLSRCRNEPSCNAAYPQLGATLEKLLTKLEKEPATWRARDPQSAAQHNITISRNVFAQGLRGLLYSSDLVALLPLTISRAEAGDYQSFVSQVTLLAQGAEQGSLGLTLSILCNEDVRELDAATLKASSKGTFLGMAEGQDMLLACQHWPHADMPTLSQDWHHDAPVLALSGAADPVTPPRWADQALTHFTDGQHVKLTYAGHNVLARGCVPRLVAEFIAQPSQAVDGQCAERFVPPAFFVDTAGPTLAASKTTAAAASDKTAPAGTP